MDGWHLMGLDVDFQIRQVLPVGFAWAQFHPWARWAQFLIFNFLYLNIYSIFKCITTFSMHPGKWE